MGLAQCQTIHPSDTISPLDTLFTSRLKRVEINSYATMHDGESAHSEDPLSLAGSVIPSRGGIATL